MRTKIYYIQLTTINGRRESVRFKKEEVRDKRYKNLSEKMGEGGVVKFKDCVISVNHIVILKKGWVYEGTYI